MGEVIALSATNGKEVWRKQLKGEVSSVPQTNGQVVAVQTMNGKLFRLMQKLAQICGFLKVLRQS